MIAFGLSKKVGDGKKRSILTMHVLAVYLIQEVVSMKRVNITLPDEVIREMKDLPNKSRFIAEALKEKLERIEREKLDRLLVEGYKATKKEEKGIDKEWEKITLEGWK